MKKKKYIEALFRRFDASMRPAIMVQGWPFSLGFRTHGRFFGAKVVL